MINEQQKRELTNQEVSKQVKIAEDVIIEYRDRLLLIKEFDKVQDGGDDKNQIKEKIDESDFYCFAYMWSKRENVEVATAQRLLLARTFFDVSGQEFDEKVDERLRRNIRFLLQDYDDIRP